MTIDVAIVGGGLSGLAIADGLTRLGCDWTLFEARKRLGGRVLSVPASGAKIQYDLGPAWIWPHNERMLAAAEKFDLKLFSQYADGNLVFQDETGSVRRDLTFSTMAGALRIAGGIGALTNALAACLPRERLHQEHAVIRISDEGELIRLSVSGPDGPIIEQARKVVFALPPRLVDVSITAGPEFPADACAAMRRTPTWMAGHAKVIAIYESPFWRTHGLSGDAISHQGPLMEIHDASPMDNAVGALFGFVGTPVERRRGNAEALKHAALDQMVALFGPDAATPVDLIYKDWALDAETATEQDHAVLDHHPAYGMPGPLLGLWQNRLHFAGTEVAPTEGGYLEGALEAAEACIERLG